MSNRPGGGPNRARRIVRKSLRVTPETNAQIRRLAACFGTSEAEVVRMALDLLDRTAADATDATQGKYDAQTLCAQLQPRENCHAQCTLQSAHGSPQAMEDAAQEEE